MKTLPKTTPEQRVSMYGDVEDLTSVGFLSHTVTIAGARLSFRSLGSGDLFVLKTHGNENWQQWVVATSLWMVDGYNLLGESNSPYHISKKINNLPAYVRDLLFSVVMGLFARQNKAIRAAEAYCYESSSRFRWKASKSISMGNVSGVAGAERFALNPVMQMWRFFNEVEDQRHIDEAQWNGFKLTASASAPKGIEKIDRHDQNRREDEENRRQDVLDKFYYMSKGVIPPDSAGNADVPSMALRSKSVEDLEGEMERWVAGDDDWHDQVVNQYKADITNRYEQERQERESRRIALQRRYEEMEMDTKPRPLVAYTTDQLEQMLKGRKPGIAQIYEDPQGSQEKMYQRHLRLAEKGLLQANDGKIIAPEGDPDLMDLISKRQVAYRTDDD